MAGSAHHLVFYSHSRSLLRRLSCSAALFALTACSSTGFQSSIGEFGKLTSVASTQQAASLAKIGKDETERIRNQQAASHVDLRLKASCGALLAQIELGTDNRKAPACEFVRQDGQALEKPPEFANIIALASGLNGYAESLVELASGHDADNTAFTSSITGLGTSLGGLDTAMRKVTNADPSQNTARLSAIAGLVDEAGRLYFAHQRAAALRKIIIAADPFIQEATALLSGADNRIGLYDRAGLAKDLIKAQDHQSKIAATASPEELRKAHDKMYDLLAAFTQRGVGAERFDAIGKAHAQLARAAAAGAKPAEIKQAILALIHLAGTIDTTADAFGTEEQEPADAN